MNGRDWSDDAASSVFADAGDKDEDAIFGKPASANADASKPRPLLNPQTGKAWLKFSVAANANRKRSRSAGIGSVHWRATAGARVGAYCQVDANVDMRAAIASCRDRVALVLDVAQVRKLAPGDASFAAMTGTASARLKFAWADVLTGPIAPLRDLLPKGVPVNFAIDRKASLTVDLALADSFRLVFVGRDAGSIAVSLHRASRASASVSAHASTSIRLQDPEMARDVLAGLAAQLLGSTPEELASVRAALERLVGAYDAAVDEVKGWIDEAVAPIDQAVDALGLPIVARRLAQLQDLFALAGLLATPVAGIADEHARVVAASSGKNRSLTRARQIVTKLDGLSQATAAEVGDQLDTLLKRLGLPSLVEKPFAAIKGLLSRLDKLEAALLEMARRRIDAGVSLEYKRIATDGIVLSAILERNNSQFEHWHRSLLGLDITSVLDAVIAGAAAGIRLEKFLHQSRQDRSFSLGINLGSLYSGKDSSGESWSSSTRVVPLPPEKSEVLVNGSATGGLIEQRRHVLAAYRMRVETLLGTTSTWRGDFDADFIASGSPGSDGQWAFALALTFSSATRTAGPRWLLAAADYAALWGVIPESGTDALGEELDAVAGGRAASVEVGLVVTREAFAKPGFLAAFDRISTLQLHDSLALALQRIDGIPERMQPDLRRRAYSAVMSVLVGEAGVDVRDPFRVARFVSRKLASASADLQRLESRTDPPNPGSVADIARRTGSVLGVIRHFRNAAALAALAEAPSTGSEDERQDVSRAVHGWDLAWRDRYLLRWQVAILRLLAAQAALPPDALTPRFKLTVGTGDTAVVHLFAPAMAT